MPRFSFSSLRVRFFLLVLFAILPALGVILYSNLEQRRLSVDHKANELASLAATAAKGFDAIIIEARHHLTMIAGHDNMFSGIIPSCRKLLPAMREHLDQYAELGVADPKGQIVCHTHPSIASATLADQTWFRRVKTTRQFAMGDREISNVSNQTAITFARPILSSSGDLRAIVFATMNSRRLHFLNNGMDRFAVETLTVTDGNFNALLRSREPHEESLAGPIPKDFFYNTIIPVGTGVAEAKDPNGIRQLFAFIRLGAIPNGNHRLIVSTPKDVAIAEPNRILQRNLTVLGLVALAILATAWIGGEFLFLRRINALLTATKLIGAANFGNRIIMVHGNDELGQLARALDEMAAQLENAEKHKADFISMIVHDLRSPLARIVSIEAMIEDRMLGPINEEQENWLGKIGANAATLLVLINDFLDLSKIEAGRIDLVKETVDLPRLIKDSIDNYQILAKHKNIALRSRAEPNLPAIQADPSRLDQVFSNLLGNSIKFTPEGGAIEMGARQENPTEIKIWVKDSGVGIGSEEMAQLFQKYRQTSSGKTSNQKGTGLGLVIVKSIVESHGGKVDVKSEVGQGSTFNVLLPLST